ncbi:U3-aranetoxin-ce1a-like isoform x1 [Biomphalaria glabrata]|nr:U3-aranetoxin-Ce1a-like [Biomphalaria glabrata]
MYGTFFWTLAALFAFSQALVGKVCRVESECDPGECCQILSEFMVMSKRQEVLLNTIAPLTKTGTCQKYKVEGDPCGHFEKINGYCSCAPGTYCHSYEIPVPTMAARSMIAPHPGFQWVSKCEKQ